MEPIPDLNGAIQQLQYLQSGYWLAGETILPVRVTKLAQLDSIFLGLLYPQREGPLCLSTTGFCVWIARSSTSGRLDGLLAKFGSFVIDML